MLAEEAANNGGTLLMSRLLMQGTTTRSAVQIATEIESLGGSIDTYGGNNSFGANVEVLSGDFSTGLDLLADVLLNPIFPEDAFEREREIFRRLVVPAPKARGLLRAVERGVDLDRGEVSARVFELARLRQVFRIERAAPGGKHPAADADPDRCGLFALGRNHRQC